MSNPYLTMYGYDESGDSMEHAWLNKAKEKEYNHQYYLRNRNRLLAEKRKMNNEYARAGQNQQNYQRNINAMQAPGNYNNKYRNAASVFQKEQKDIYDDLKRNEAYNRSHAGEGGYEGALKRKALHDKIKNAYKQQTGLVGYTIGKSKELDRKQGVARGQAMNAYNAEVARQRKGLRDNNTRAANAGMELGRLSGKVRANAQAESRAKIAEANTLPKRLKREARKLSYKVGAPIDRAARKLKDKATEVVGKAKAAYEKARNQLRALRGAGGAGAVVGNAAYKAKQAALNRAKELYQKAKDKVKKYASDAYNKITGRNS